MPDPSTGFEGPFGGGGPAWRCSVCGVWGHWTEAAQREHHEMHEREAPDVDPEVEDDLKRERRAREAEARRERRHASLPWQFTHRDRRCKNPYCAEWIPPEAPANKEFHDPACQKRDARRREREGK